MLYGEKLACPGVTTTVNIIKYLYSREYFSQSMFGFLENRVVSVSAQNTPDKLDHIN